MRHLADGVLRRMVDDPLAIPDPVQRHYAACTRCRQRGGAIAAATQATAELLRLPELSLLSAPALTDLRVRLAAQGRHAPSWYHGLAARLQLAWPRWSRPLFAAGVAALLALALVATGTAQNLLTIFEPKEFVPVPVSRADLERAAAFGLPDLSDYGVLNGNPPRLHGVADAQAAAAETGLPQLAPSSLPSGVSQHVDYRVLPEATGSFTFSAERARAAATRAGRKAPAVPAKIDGSTLYLTIGPAVLAVYGPAGGNMGALGLPVLAVVEAKTPKVSSTGVSAQELENYLLAQPGIPPGLAAQIRAIGDPKSTLPIPIPVDLASARPVQVQGVPGLLVADATGLGSGVIWQKDGIVYAVAGMVTQSQVLAVAGSLH